MMITNKVIITNKVLCHSIAILMGIGCSIVCSESPYYRVLDVQTQTPRRVSTKSVQLSRYPTPLAVALTNNRGQLRSVDIDGKVVQSSTDSDQDRQVIYQLEREPACAALSPNGRIVASADWSGNLSVVDLDSRLVRFQVDGSSPVASLRFDDKSEQLACTSTDGSVRWWNCETGELLGQTQCQRGTVQSIVFSPDGHTIAVAALSDTIHLIPTRDGNENAPTIQPLTISGCRVSEMAFTPESDRLVVASADGAIRIVDLYSDQPHQTLPSHPFATWTIRFSNQGNQMVTASQDGSLRIWEMGSWELTQTVKAHEESVIDAVLDSSVGLIAAGMDGRLICWPVDAQSRSANGVVEGRSDAVWITTFSPDGSRMFVGGANHRFELWDVAKMTIDMDGSGPKTTRCASFSHDGRIVAVGGDDKVVRICDSHTGETVKLLGRHPGAVSEVLFVEGDERLISVCDAGWTKSWDLKTGREVTSTKQHRRQIYCAQFSPDRSFFATGGGFWLGSDPGEIVLWDTQSMAVKSKLNGHRLSVWSIALFPDGDRLAATDSTGVVKIWNLTDDSESQTLSHSTWVRALAIAPNGKTLYVARGDGSIRLWDTETWKQRASFDGHSKFCFALQFAPDGQTLVSSSDDGTIRFWNE